MPLVRAQAVDNWATPRTAAGADGAGGARRRGHRRRSARRDLGAHAELVELFDALVQATTGGRFAERQDDPPAGAARVENGPLDRKLRAALAPDRHAGSTIGLVRRDDGSEGHLSLIRRAREQSDVVVVSLFVNPTQFNESSDLASSAATASATPRSPPRPASTTCCARRPRRDVPGPLTTTVWVFRVTEQLKALHPRPRPLRRRRHRRRRPAQFHRRPRQGFAYFSQKDAQQALMIPASGPRPRHSRVRDRNLPDQAGRRAGDVGATCSCSAAASRRRRFTERCARSRRPSDRPAPTRSRSARWRWLS